MLECCLLLSYPQPCKTLAQNEIILDLYHVQGLAMMVAEGRGYLKLAFLDVASSEPVGFPWSSLINLDQSILRGTSLSNARQSFVYLFLGLSFIGQQRSLNSFCVCPLDNICCMISSTSMLSCVPGCQGWRRFFPTQVKQLRHEDLELDVCPIG